ncbi:GTP cyclohydrolase I [Diaminobutyricimonas sp. LJ205]|uniref:GTP cyclohydrolase I n=1 Tax=Diaminobutyricimonas sp. LJ205 TaxID=2683590 RepID=UPI0012F49EA2|nr:GTP cyclohydrolase I [Diaminobutyricimonas sp. LJ205]
MTITSSTTALRAVEPALPDVDRDRAIAAAADLITALGRDLDTENLRETPRRLVDALLELTSPVEFSATTFPNSDGYDELVLVRDIPFQSLCEHHLLPFRGTATIGYLPGDRLLGLSKVARVLEYFSRDLQVQERLTRQVAEWFEREVQPRGVGVVLEAEHLCMTLRGVHAAGTSTVTSAFFGTLAQPGAHRRQFGLEVAP